MSFAGVAVGVAAVGVGISGLSAGGVFNGKVDKWQPTQQELDATAQSRKLFKFGQDLQRPVDALSREDIQRLRSPGQQAMQGGAATSAVMDQAAPVINGALERTAVESGGPGSGRWFAQLGTAGGELNSGLRSANAAGRLGAVQSATGRAGQYLDRMTGDVQTGMGLMEQAAGQAANRQADRINAQVQNNMARNQAMGQLGGAMLNMGMSGLGAASAAGGVMGGGASAGGAGGAGMAGAMNPNAGAPYGGYVFANPAIR